MSEFRHLSCSIVLFLLAFAPFGAIVFEGVPDIHRDTGTDLPSSSDPPDSPQNADTLGRQPTAYEGFDGCSWRRVVPMNRITAVRYDETSYWDDYAYLASVPASVFHSESDDRLYSSPLLFYEPPSGDRMENTHKGLAYFMDDWTNYTGSHIDEAVLINLSSGEADDFLNRWPVEPEHGKTEEYRDITIFELARDISLADWDISGTAVVAVVREDAPPVDITHSGIVNGTMPAGFSRSAFRVSGTIDVSPALPFYHNFSVDEPTRYVSAYMSWSGAGKDPDLQLYDWNLGQVAASERWNPVHGASESAGSYAYNRGPWAAAVTYMPTESLPVFSTTDVNPVNYDIDISQYPGVDITLPETPYWCRNVTITLSWPDAGQELGLALCGPGGENIKTSLAGNNPTVLSPVELGRGNHTATVLKLDGHAQNTDFTLTYSWSQQGSEEMRDALTGASGGAVLASMLNAPLLYTTNVSLPEETLEALEELNVSDVILIDIGGRGGDTLAEVLDNGTGMISVTGFEQYNELTDAIASISDSGDVIISTLDPFTKWSMDKTPGTETPAGLYIGPSAFTAAHHGAPLLLCEDFDPLSSAKAWHNTYWHSQWNSRTPPSVGDMVLTGGQIYDVFEELGLNGDEMESVLSVAGQYDMGVAWDRSLVGAAVPGRIIGSPTDAAYSISRNLFYPAVIYSSPALEPTGVDLINGSMSRREAGDILSVYRQEEEVNAKYPILETWVSYEHRFNERASRYWGTNYTCANGIVPFWDESGHPIDLDVNAKYGRPGMYWPDLTNSEALSFYGRKCGYEPVYSTYYPKCAENLNRGVIMWLETMHGGQSGSGILGFWKGGSEPEVNPWRAYETHGSTDDPDTMAMRKDTGADTHWSQGEDDRDGVIIAINEQSHTTHVSGQHMDDTLDNIHSTGFLAGSCLIANTFLHLSLIRHGSVFQVIDPWVTSWYASYGYEIFMRYLALNMTVGQAYQKCMEFVGIQYLTGQWWWDVLENVVYFGDPDLRVFVPEHSWERPVSLDYSKKIWLDGHTPFGKFTNVGITGINVSDPFPDQFENITLNVSIFNDGSMSLRKLPVGIYLDGVEIQRLTVLRVDPHVPAEISWTFNITEWGEHEIEVELDPLNLFDEMNESDNICKENLSVNALPLAALALSSPDVSTGETILFDASGSTDPDGSVAGYMFDFGDGNTSGWIEVAIIEYGYGNNGTYGGSVSVMDERGSVARESAIFLVVVHNRAPLVNITATPGFEVLTYEEVDLNASGSSDPDGSIAEWNWDSGDNRTFSGSTARFHYENDGNYTVTLTLTDDDGESTVAGITVTVLNRAPIPGFSVEPGTRSGNRSSFYTFTSEATDRDGVVKEIEWDMGDGTVIRDEITFVHRYRELGRFNVTLRATDDDGETTVSEPYSISIENTAPAVDITVNATVKRTFEAFRFRAMGLDPDGFELSYRWDLGDGSNDTGEVVEHHYTDDGTYTVICRISDEDGADNVSSVTVSVLNRAPVARFSAGSSRIEAGSFITFDAGESGDMDGAVPGYGWDFGDGNTGSGTEVVHAWKTAGRYVINLTVTDDDGARSFASLEIEVVEPQGMIERYGAMGMVIAIPVILLLFLAVVFLLIWRKRAGGRKEIKNIGAVREAEDVGDMSDTSNTGDTSDTSDVNDRDERDVAGKDGGEAGRKGRKSTSGQRGVEPESGNDDHARTDEVSFFAGAGGPDDLMGVEGGDEAINWVTVDESTGDPGREQGNSEGDPEEEAEEWDWLDDE